MKDIAKLREINKQQMLRGYTYTFSSSTSQVYLSPSTWASYNTLLGSGISQGQAIAAQQQLAAQQSHLASHQNQLARMQNMPAVLSPGQFIVPLGSSLNPYIDDPPVENFITKLIKKVKKLWA